VGAELGLPWAERVFGKDDAETLRGIIKEALTAACVQSQDAQDASRARRLDPFGHSLWPLQFQELADRIAEGMPDKHRLEYLEGYSLAVINGYVLYPVRSAKPKDKAKNAMVRKPVSKFRRRIFSAIGPEPHQEGLWPLQAAEEVAKDVQSLLARLGSESRLAVISYVCEFKPGLTDVFWGEAELNFQNGTLAFHDGESLSLLPNVGAAARQRATQESNRRSQAFSGGDLPEIRLGTNPSHQRPITEAQPSKPQTNDEKE
jgi:hypothetical protein